ncbi:YybS family protein [Alphaproteobacteria bacterium]|nr:YybS family protein [Alphaproteobacteria bacterium]MDA8643200.1 YybS family protein [Alphaproteobacteria bacterium]MDA9590487.1 YybS family protein [Alphaproteobacteria bacterium]MDB2432321.1 YybS family protein [Alphaproteobacteria bacterium]MDB2477740.1 YybS family protein [Alphaproteobacteria bacterium]
MANTQLLRIVFAAIGSFVLFAALIFMPVAPAPVAAIGLSFGVAQAVMVSALAIIMTAIILSPPLAIVFAITFLVPTVVLVRQALLSRQDESCDYIFFPLQQLILLALGMTAIGTILLFLITGGANGLPMSFANALQQSPEVRTALVQVYGISTDEEMLWIASIMLVSGFASWPLLLLGNLQIAQAILVRMKRNLRPQEVYDRLQLPRGLIVPLLMCMGGAALLPGWPAILSAALAAMILAAYFLLGLAIIHAISRHWNGRGLLLVTLYFLIFVMAWVIIPVSLMGLLDTRFDFRKLNQRPDKPSDLEGDEE